MGNNLVQNYDYYAWNEKTSVEGINIGQGGRLKNITVGSLQDLGYVYDAAGNLRTITDSLTSEIQSFRYDVLDRLMSATVTGGPAPYAEKYTYDAATGNLAIKATSIDQPSNPGLVGLAGWWSMDETSGQRLDSYHVNHLTDINTVGSATGLKGKAASFVPANLEALTAADHWLFSGGDVDFTLIANVYLNNNANTFVILDKSDNASAYDYRIAHNPGTGFRFRVGAGSAYVDSGAVTANAWHTVIAWHDSVNNTINIQVDNGVVNSLPSLGRFAQADTIIPVQTQGVQAWDRYAYTNNNPLRYDDPTGHCIGLLNCVREIVNATMFLGIRAWEKGGINHLLIFEKSMSHSVDPLEVSAE